MLVDVGERLGTHEIDRCLQLCRQAPTGDRDSNRGHTPGPERAKSATKTGLGEQAGVQASCESTELFERFGEFDPDLVERLAGRLGACESACLFELRCQVLQPMFSSVSQTALQASMLLVASRHNSASGRIQRGDLDAHLGLETSVDRSQPRRGRDRLDQTRVVEQRLMMDEHSNRTIRPVDPSSGAVGTCRR